MGKPRASAPRKIGCVQHDCEACRRLMKLARNLTVTAHRRGPTDPDYWAAVEAVEAELIRRSKPSSARSQKTSSAKNRTKQQSKTRSSE